MKKIFYKRIIQSVVAVFILMLALAVSLYFIKTPPVAKKRHRTSITPLVEIVIAKTSSPEYRFTAMGTVIADQEIDLKPRVSGQILSVNSSFTPGGFFHAGEEVIRIDPEDYRLTLAQQQSEVAKARAELNLEMGNQLVAEKEFQLLGKKVNQHEKELMLRGPQLASARATLQAAQAKLEIARTDLNNTKVTIPFNAVLTEKDVDTGSRVTSSTTLGHFVGTDKFLIRITLPVEKLHWINDKLGTASPITIQEENSIHTGVISNISSELEENSHMAVVYGVINDPLCLSPNNKGKSPLLLGSFIQVEITGPKLKNLIAIDRNALRENNTIWILGKDGKLIIRPVDIAARDQEKIYIRSGIDEGDQIIVSSIDSPSPEMLLKTAGDTTDDTSRQNNQKTTTGPSSIKEQNIEKTP